MRYTIKGRVAKEVFKTIMSEDGGTMKSAVQVAMAGEKKPKIKLTTLETTIDVFAVSMAPGFLFSL